jgi:asparagine synthase (glutamine-hydrolysing)
MFRNTSSKHRRWINSSALLSNLGKNGAFSRTAWGMLSLELWHQQFHDVAHLGRKHVASLCD